MEMPKPGPQHLRLAALVGSWTADEHMSPSPWDPKGGTARGFIEARLVLDGMHLASDYRQERDGRVTYRGHGVYGWDAQRRAYTMYWFDSMGSDPGGPALGTWEGDALRFETRTPMGLSRYDYRFEGDGRYAFAISRSQDGQAWTRWLDSVWVRK